MHTHYDNLKVARNAPPEVIKAAYKSLSQKYHPDRNPDNPDASRIMSIINASYEVLSDPNKRIEHDLWISQQQSPQSKFTQATNTQQNKNLQPINVKPVLAHILRNWILYLVLAGFIWGSMSTESTSVIQSKPYKFVPDNKSPENEPSIDEFLNSPDSKTSTDRNQAHQRAVAYHRPLSAPNGEAWPKEADYVKGYPKLNTLGRSSVTIDNHQNDSDVFVKLVYLSGADAHPVRQFFIPAFGEFTLKNINQGQYDIRYRDLDNGGLSRSESFELTEIQLEGGIQFSKYTMTLYKVHNGNMQTYALSEDEF